MTSMPGPEMHPSRQTRNTVLEVHRTAWVKQKKSHELLRWTSHGSTVRCIRVLASMMVMKGNYKSDRRQKKNWISFQTHVKHARTNKTSDASRQSTDTSHSTAHKYPPQIWNLDPQDPSRRRLYEEFRPRYLIPWQYFLGQVNTS
jgi:hypothetical protein